MTDLVEFLRARLDEDEQVAREAKDILDGNWTYTETPGGDHKVVDNLGYSVSGHYDVEGQPWWTGPHIARHDPARVLAEVEANRRIIKRYVHLARRAEDDRAAGTPSRSVQDGRDTLYVTLLDLATVYADHPDYREEWKL